MCATCMCTRIPPNQPMFNRLAAMGALQGIWIKFHSSWTNVSFVWPTRCRQRLPLYACYDDANAYPWPFSLGLSRSSILIMRKGIKNIISCRHPRRAMFSNERNRVRSVLSKIEIPIRFLSNLHFLLYSFFRFVYCDTRYNSKIFLSLFYWIFMFMQIYVFMDTAEKTELG